MRHKKQDGKDMTIEIIKNGNTQTIMASPQPETPTTVSIAELTPETKATMSTAEITKDIPLSPTVTAPKPNFMAIVAEFDKSLGKIGSDTVIQPQLSADGGSVSPKLADFYKSLPQQEVKTTLKSEVVTITPDHNNYLVKVIPIDFDAVKPCYMPEQTKSGSFLLRCHLTQHFGDNVWWNGGTFVREESILIKTGVKYTKKLEHTQFYLRGISTLAARHGIIVNSAPLEFDHELCVMIHIYEKQIRILQGDIIAEMVVTSAPEVRA